MDARFSTSSAAFTRLVQLAGDDGPHDTASEPLNQSRIAIQSLITGLEDEECEEEDAEDSVANENRNEQPSAADSGRAAGHAELDSSPAPLSSPNSTTAASTSDASAPLSSFALASFSAEMAATGLLYFSRLPPHMKPHKLRQLLSQYGHILRIYLTPEHQSLTQRRRTATAASSSAAKRYTDGWVEFADKRVAKAVAVTLNGTTMGGRKRGYWYDDVWSCKYLKGFKWQHLTERAVMAGKAREGRRREEVSRAKRDAEHYRQQMDKRKKVEAIRARKDKQRKTDSGRGAAGEEAAEGDDRPVLRTFHQRPAFPGKPLEE